MELPDPWPLRHLVLRTPRLELRPDDDEGLLELAAEAHRGVHPPEVMPFVYAWTDEPADERGTNSMRHFWRKRGELSARNWHVSFLVRSGGAVLGVQELFATEFGVRRECETGSWLGMRHHGNGFGTEMRAAILLFAFDHLGATQVRSGTMADNAASLAVSRRLGYVEDGTELYSPRGVAVTGKRLLLTRERFAQHRPEWTLDVTGLAPVLDMLGAG